MLEEIICSGFGGQGVMLMGKLIALAALKEDKHVTYLPAYGAEVRGGTAHCMIKISDKEIASPIIIAPGTCFAMNEPAYNKFANRLKPKGLLIMNSSLIKKINYQKEIMEISIPLTDMASSLGNIKVANTIALGAYIARKKIIKLATMLSAMSEMAGKQRDKLLEINEKALKEGMRYGKS